MRQLRSLKAIAGLSETLFAVFNGAMRTEADAGHAMGAIAVPDGAAVCQRDIAPGAELCAPAAADTGVRRDEGGILYDKGIEKGIHPGRS